MSSFFTGNKIKLNLTAFNEAIRDYINRPCIVYSGTNGVFVHNASCDPDIDAMIANVQSKFTTIDFSKNKVGFPQFVESVLTLKKAVIGVVLLVEQVAVKTGDMSSSDKKELATDLLRELVELPSPIGFFIDPILAIAIGFVVDEINRFVGLNQWPTTKLTELICKT